MRKKSWGVLCHQSQTVRRQYDIFTPFMVRTGFQWWEKLTQPSAELVIHARDHSAGPLETSRVDEEATVQAAFLLTA